MAAKKPKPAKFHPWKRPWAPKNPTPYLPHVPVIPKSAKMGID